MLDDDDDDDFMSDFDPYQTLVDISNFVEILAHKQNQLIDDYRKTKSRLKSVEDRIIKLEIFLMNKDL